MRISPTWLREFVGLDVDNARLAEDLTHAGIAVEAISGHGDATVFEMDITTNRVDAMNHYGVARECSAIYDVDLKPIAPKLPKLIHPESFAIEILDPDLCARYTARVVCDVHIEKSPRYIAERLLIESITASTTLPTRATTRSWRWDIQRTPSIGTRSKVARSSCAAHSRVKN